MSKKNFIAQHDGHTWKRSSQNRVYSHAVIGKFNLDADRSQAEQSARTSWERNFEYLVYAAQGKPVPGYMYDISAEKAARAQAELDAGIESYIARAMAAYDAYAKDFKKASDGIHFYSTDASWSSRLELAKKAAGYTDIILVAVQS
jgi:hypothetical protein